MMAGVVPTREGGREEGREGGREGEEVHSLRYGRKEG